MAARKKSAKRGELNVANRTLFIRDNIGVLDGLNSECVDLIYLDPPFNSNRHYSAPIGSKAAGASFKDAWTLDDIDLAWIGQIAERHSALAAILNAAGLGGGKGDKAYLVFMARRLLEMHRVLKPTGSIYLHCDPAMSHALKMVMDAIFGKARFRNQIIWRCNSGISGFKSRAGRWCRNHDVILYYAKSAKGFTFVKMNYADGRGLSEKFHTVGTRIDDSWTDVMSMQYQIVSMREGVGYPTQKPLALLERIICASSNEGDVVLDPFCGCATACVAAETLGRRWIGVDIAPKAKDLMKTRLQDAQDMLTTKGAWKKVSVREDFPVRTDEGDLMVNPKQYSHELYGMQDGKCAGCRCEFQFRNMTVDHIEPREEGGRDIKPNLQLLCGWCNSVKGSRTMSYLLARLKKDGIIN